MAIRDKFLLVQDFGKRVALTFFEGAAGTFLTLFAASGLSVKDLLDVSGLGKLWTSVGVGAVAAGLSAVYHLLDGYLKTKKDAKLLADRYGADVGVADAPAEPDVAEPDAPVAP